LIFNSTNLAKYGLGFTNGQTKKKKKQTPHHCGVCEEFTKKEMPLHFLFRITK
jgi:hypothetical protein